MAGLNPTINLSGNNDDYIRLKRYDLFLEAGIGCDFYLPFFKLRPELKFMYSLTNSFDRNHASQLKDKTVLPYAMSVNKAHSKLIVLRVSPFSLFLIRKSERHLSNINSAFSVLIYRNKLSIKVLYIS